MTNKQSISTDDAIIIVINFVGFLAQDESRFERFCALTGLDRESLAGQLAAQNHHFMASILDYALQDEALLLAFASNEQLPPEIVVKARSKFPGDEF
jgi:hypothetical protein